MKHILAASFFFLGAVCCASAQTSTIDSTISALLELKHVKASLEHTKLDFERQSSDSKEVAQIRSTINSVLNKNHAPNLLYSYIFGYLRQRYDRDRAASLIKSFQSAFIRKFAQLEYEKQISTNQDSLVLFKERLNSYPPSKERQNLVQRIERAINRTEMTLAISTNSFRTFILGINPALPPDKRVSLKKLEDLIAAGRNKSRPQVQEDVYVQILYIYQNTSDYALSEYVKFMESDDSRWFTATLNAAILLAFRVAGENSRIEIGEALRR